MENCRHNRRSMYYYRFYSSDNKGCTNKKAGGHFSDYVHTLDNWPLPVAFLWDTSEGYDNYWGECSCNSIQRIYTYFAL